ncbi:MAG: hypothetical protein FJ102_11580 [Deltaproteobacteria bacterium]|nr:hypothetical protein [Deltaproteobacteria bacterium]
MTSLLLISSVLFASAARADDRVPVLVGALQARNEESASLAALIESFVAQKLGEYDSLRVIRIEDTPDFEDYSARVYMDSCPPGEAVGCTFVLAERGEAWWAVTGSVQALVKGTRVDIDIIDVDGSRVAVSFRSELEGGRDEAFAEGVARVLVAAISGEVGKEEDIRDAGEDSESTELSAEEKAAVAAELDTLTQSLGDFDLEVRKASKTISRPKLTEEDIAEAEEGEGAKPWERLKMSAPEYLRYRNSGMTLPVWRKRIQGRRFQVILRGGGGFMNGPVNGEYYGRYALDEQTLTAVDVYSAQSVESGSTGVGVVQAAFGVHPVVDVGVTLGIAGGAFEYTISPEVVGQTNTASKPTVVDNSNLMVGPWVTAGLFPAANLRPTFGAGALWMRGTGVANHIQPPDELASFDAESLWLVNVFVGGEARLADSVEFFAQVPVSFLVGGDVVQEEKHTVVAALEGVQVPAGASALGVSVVAGVQIRIGGARVQETTLLDETDEL